MEPEWAQNRAAFQSWRRAGSTFMSGTGRGRNRTLAAIALEFLDPQVERVAFRWQRRANPLSEREFVLEIRWQGVKAGGDAAVWVAGTEHQPANAMKQYGPRAHQAGLKRGEQRHLCAAGSEMWWKAAQRFDLCMAGQFDGWIPYSVHPPGDDLAVQDDHGANREIAFTSCLLGEANSFPEKRKIILEHYFFTLPLDGMLSPPNTVHGPGHHLPSHDDVMQILS